jgi:serine/threonine protein kinase
MRLFPSHPNLVPIVGLCATDAFVFLVLPEAEWCVLEFFRLHIVPHKVLTKIVHGLLLGLDALLRARIIHRDIKPENALVTRTPEGDLVGQLCDFGLGEKLRPHDKTRTSTGREGTQRNMPLEQALSDNFGPEVDMWAIGTILYRLVTGEPLLSNIPDHDPSFFVQALSTAFGLSFQVHYKQASGFDKPIDADDLSRETKSVLDNIENPETRDLLAACFTFDPKARATPTQALKLPFFAGAQDPVQYDPNTVRVQPLSFEDLSAALQSLRLELPASQATSLTLDRIQKSVSGTFFVLCGFPFSNLNSIY